MWFEYSELINSSGSGKGPNREKAVCKTLLVEDNHSFRRDLKDLLSQEFPFMVVEEAADGTEAMEKVEGFVPDLIFMDIKLPREDGLKLTRRIKSGRAEMVIVIFTGYDLPEYRMAARQSGADYFLSKQSSTRKEILTLVQSILSGKRCTCCRQGEWRP
jgi:DNA-binding NarL/FixJ family response regulator